MNGLVRFGLGLAQVPSDLIGDIDKALPGAAALIADAKGMEDDLKALEPLIEQAMPIIERLLPKLKAAYPNAVALLPVAEKVIAFVSDKKA